MSKFLDDYLERLPDIPLPKFKVRKDDVPEMSVCGELAVLDQAIINTVRTKYPSLFVDDLDKFVLEFCNQYPYYRGSVVKERVEQLRARGWK